MKVAVLNQKGEEVSQTLLPKELFDRKINLDLIYQVATSQASNRRIVIAHTKSRAEVSGGGRKPWRQKGLGRARHGSTRSPIWRHGGITFGPRKERNFNKKINQRMKRLALFMVLSAKAKNNLLILLDELKMEKAKTKFVAQVLSKLPLKKESVLFVLPTMDKNLILALRNIPNLKTLQAKDLNCLDLLSFKYLIMLKDSIKIIKETLLKTA